MIRVDAHHHIWRLDRGDYGWLAPGMAIYRDYGLDDLRPLLEDKIDATILVQAAATEAETDYLLEVARGSDGLVKGVVGWLDLAAADAAKRINERAKDPLLKGLRPMLQDIEDPYWILRDEIRPALRAMAETGLRFDALIQPRHLPLLPIFHGMNPNLKIVIDHGAKPPIRSKTFQPWADDLARVARETDAYCKLSGLATQASEMWSMNDIRPFADHILDCFGPSRTMWGSDWPVIELATPYRRWHTITERFLFRYHIPERAEVMGGTAARFYGLT
jgi:L-fuconolactonase